MSKKTPDELVGLTPMQDLILDVLVARYRLGERMWPILRKGSKKALDGLVERGLVHVQSGPTSDTHHVWLTDLGQKLLIENSGGYVPQVVRETIAQVGRYLAQIGHPDLVHVLNLKWGIEK